MGTIDDLHSEDAVQVTQHVASSQVLKQPPAEKVLNNLIYNYSPHIAGRRLIEASSNLVIQASVLFCCRKGYDEDLHLLRIYWKSLNE
ncbi:putative gamma-glutamyl hydrolase 3 [Ananas comosus]|uniref:Putative gamma-glutamyl hydrolase 3 n=1 Tax=Ananas comosus TaxID=4615 RepID=A0A199UXV3_ANACO|nr:putative gamma-glutamyl hydrolase 3 [Ananas comosus]